MDPKANIARQRELAAEIAARQDAEDGTDDDYDFAAAAFELAELVRALDEWRSNGGFDPYPDVALPTTRDGVRQQIRRTV